ncbi:MAG: arginine repressor [Caulobacteraceae bacterium]
MSEPMSKTRRQRLIADLIRSGAVASQDDVVEQLGREGLAVTQATISRDLAELGAVKVRRDGRSGYALPDDLDAVALSDARLNRLLAEWVIGAEIAGNLIVLKTPPGSAHLVGSAMDHARWPEIAGTVAGDDTLLLVVRDGFAVADVMVKVKDAAGL